MKIDMKKRNIQTMIIVLWLLVIVATGILFYGVECKLHIDQAKTSLGKQADDIANLIPDILENNFYVDVGSMRVMFSKFEAVAEKLQEYESITEAKPFLDDLKTSVGIENLVVLDKEGNLLYGSEDEMKALKIDPTSVALLLESKAYEKAAEELSGDIGGYDTFVRKNYLQYGSIQLSGKYSWGVDGRWLISFSNTKPLAQLEIRDYFDWKNVIQRISVGEDGFLLAIKSDDGTILSNPDSSINGMHFNALEMTMQGSGQVSDISELLSGFEEKGTVREVSIKGTEYLATKLDLEEALLLALLPVSEVNSDITQAMVLAVSLVSLITGLGVLFVLLHLHDHSDELSIDQSNGIWNKTLSSKLKIAGILGVTISFMLAMYLNYLSSYADVYRYSTTKVDSVVSLVEENQNAVDMLEDWFDAEYTSRTKIIKCILKHTDPEKITRSYIDNLSNTMGFRYVYLFDGSGNIVVTNSRYDKITIDGNSPFHAVLEGMPELVVPSEYDPLLEGNLTKVAVSMVDDDGTGDGLILIYTTSEESRIIKVNLGYRSAFKQVSMADGSIVMVVDGDTQDVRYFATVNNGEYVIGESIGMSISSIGLSEEKLIKEFNGDQFFRNKLYFMSVKQMGGRFFITMKPQDFMSRNYNISVLIIVAATLLFYCVLPYLACRGNIGKKKPKTAAPAHTAFGSKVEEVKKDVRLLFGDVLRTKKPFFEERWSNDCKKWKEKTVPEKFPIIVRSVLFVALLAITIHYMVSGDDSIWYYCIHGEWGGGINLYTITSCMLTICGLIIAKAVIHKLLFMIAKASNRRGETLCYLLDRYCPYIGFFVGLFVCLSNFGINPKTLTLTGGAVGVIFGIGCQTIVADILAGFIMTIEGVVHNGDLVALADTSLIVGRAPVPGSGPVRGPGSISGGGIGPAKDESMIVLCVGTRTIKLKCGTGEKVIRNNEFKNYVLQPVD
jgi:small conductance mechanosensitive channel